MWPAANSRALRTSSTVTDSPPSSLAARSSGSICSIRLTWRPSERQAVMPPARKPRTRSPTDASSSAASSSYPSEAATTITSTSGGTIWATLVPNPVS